MVREELKMKYAAVFGVLYKLIQNGLIYNWNESMSFLGKANGFGLMFSYISLLHLLF